MQEEEKGGEPSERDPRLQPAEEEMPEPLSGREYRAQEKSVDKMSRDGLTRKNLVTGETKRISDRDVDVRFAEHEADFTFSRPSTRRPLRTDSNRNRLKFWTNERDEDGDHSPLHFDPKENDDGPDGQNEYAAGEMHDNPFDSDQDDQFEETADSNYEDARESSWRGHFALDKLTPWRDRAPYRALCWTKNRTLQGSRLWLHKKVREVEDNNLGVKAAHAEERIVEQGVRSIIRYSKNKNQRSEKKITKLKGKVTKTAAQAELARLRLEKFDLRNSASSMKEDTKAAKRAWQKKRLQRKYNAKLRKSKQAASAAGKATEKVTQEAATIIGRILKKISEVISTVASIGLGMISWLIFVVLGLLLVLIMVIFVLQLFVVSTSYLAEDVEIEKASLYVTQLEAELDKQIRDIPNQPEWGYIDEFNFNLDPIDHNPFELIAWLTAKYDDFVFEDIKGYLQEMHNARYDLTLEVETEEREDEDGDPYTWYILNVTLTSMSIYDLIAPELELDPDKLDLKERYEVLMESKGNHQMIANPFDFDWTNSYSSKYGWRVDPIGGENLQIHRGLDIPMPTGTPIRAGVTGTVTAIDYNNDFGLHVFIEDEKGEVSIKYAHCDQIYLTVGEPVTAGKTIIGAVGNTGNSTGSHLHIEVKEKGEYLNPIFVVDFGEPKIERG